MTKRVLCVVSEHGFWAQELLLPVDRLESAGIEVHVATPTGARPAPDGEGQRRYGWSPEPAR